MDKISYENISGQEAYDSWKASEAAYEYDLMNHIRRFPSGCSNEKCGYCKEYGSRLFENSREK